MSKILFDIVLAHEPPERVHLHIVMEVSLHIFSYAVLTPEKKILQLRFYELDAHNQHELATELERIIAADEVLQEQMEKTTCLYNFPESQLVPEDYFDSNASPDLLELFHGDLDQGITLSERIQGSGRYNVFRVPPEVHHLLQRQFKNNKSWHFYSLWMQCDHQQATERPNYLSVMFYPNRLLVSVVKDKELHLLQSYAYEAAEDVGYYLLNICSQLQLDPAQTPVLLSGMIDISSVLYSGIFKYFGQVELEGFPGIANEPALQEYPAHFFSPLLKLAVCAS